MSKLSYLVFSLIIFLTDCPTEKYTMIVKNNSSYDLKIQFYQTSSQDNSVSEYFELKIAEGSTITGSTYDVVICDNPILNKNNIFIYQLDSLLLFYTKDNDLYKIDRVPDYVLTPSNPWHNYDEYDPLVNLFRWSCSALIDEIIFTNEYLEQAIKVEE